jgi:hypothetical protein
MDPASRRACTPPQFHAARRAPAGAACASLALALLALLPHAGYACASCGCTLSADAAAGYSALPGWRLMATYDYIQQDELRSGTQSVTGVPDGTELERDTLSRYVTVALGYSPTPAWNVSLFVPYVIRSHSTYGEFDAAQPLPPPSSSYSSSLGDLRVVLSYQGFLPTNNLGIQLGVKLPTGEYGTAVKFSAGPEAGEPLDASLQPGTGSTDLMLGAYYYRAISQDFDFFANALFQAAVSERLDQPGNDYRPGNSTLVSLGLRYAGGERFFPQVQVNLLHKSPDQGALADTGNSGGSVAYVSPGLTLALTPRLQTFGYVQLPVYSNLEGYQLFPRYTLTIGATYAF